MALYTLLEYGQDPFNSRFEDTQNRTAFSLSLASQSPNLVIKLTRDSSWSSQYDLIMGPDKSYFYFGPSNGPGYVVYGNTNISIPMGHMRRLQKVGSTSRHFTAQSGREYKWRISPSRMECVNGRTILAIWQASETNHEYDHDATLTLTTAGMSLVTEVLTTLILNRMFMKQGW